MDFKKVNSSVETADTLYRCCGSKAWIERMQKTFPADSSDEIFDNAERIWFSLEEDDWLEAFSHHPKIGDLDSLKEKFASTSDIAKGEQSGVKDAPGEILKELKNLNEEYEKKFGFIFIVCASGKSAAEMLSMIKERIKNIREDEIKIAAQEQNKITKLRLEKLL